MTRQDAEAQASATLPQLSPASEHRFTFDKVDRIGPFCFGVLALIATIAFSILPLTGNIRVNDPIVMAAFFCGVSIFLILVLLNAFIRTSDIVVDDFAVRRRILGRDFSVTAWTELRRVRVNQATILADSSRKIDQYFLDTTLAFRFPNTKGAPIMFTDQVGNVRDLLDFINIQIAKHNIPIIDCRDGQQGTSLTRL